MFSHLLKKVEYCRISFIIILFHMMSMKRSVRIMLNVISTSHCLTWHQEHLAKRGVSSTFYHCSLISKKAKKEYLAEVYPEFDGEFDLWKDGIRIEVKSCRANSQGVGKSLASRAYLHKEAKENGFKYHYQQLKPSCCDVFIWIGVCRDELIYWVLTSEELKATGKLGSQHRNENTGNENAEVFEGQVFMTEEELSKFVVPEKEVLAKVVEKGTK